MTCDVCTYEISCVDGTIQLSLKRDQFKVTVPIKKSLGVVYNNKKYIH